MDPFVALPKVLEHDILYYIYRLNLEDNTIGEALNVSECADLNFSAEWEKFPDGYDNRFVIRCADSKKPGVQTIPIMKLLNADITFHPSADTMYVPMSCAW